MIPRTLYPTTENAAGSTSCNAGHDDYKDDVDDEKSDHDADIDEWQAEERRERHDERCIQDA